MSLRKTYRAGDLVYPQDLPRRFLCRVLETEDFRLPTGRCQLLKLAPLEGPWPRETVLIRLDRGVRRDGSRDESRGGSSARRPARATLARGEAA